MAILIRKVTYRETATIYYYLKKMCPFFPPPRFQSFSFLSIFRLFILFLFTWFWLYSIGMWLALNRRTTLLPASYRGLLRCPARSMTGVLAAETGLVGSAACVMRLRNARTILSQLGSHGHPNPCAGRSMQVPAPWLQEAAAALVLPCTPLYAQRTRTRFATGRTCGQGE